MSARKLLLAAAILAASLAAPATAAAAAPAPAWSVQSLATPTNFAPGEPEEVGKQPRYQVFITNSGGAQAQGTVTITDTLPAGLEVKSTSLVELSNFTNAISGTPCETTGTEVETVTCEVTSATLPKPEAVQLVPGDALALQIEVKVPLSASGPLRNRVEVEGGGPEVEAVTVESVNQASSANAKAGFEEFKSELTGADGRPASAAASHPFQFTTSFAANLVATPPESSSPFVPAEGDLKEVEVRLPPGLAANPTAVERCTAQELATHKSFFSPTRGDFVNTNSCPPGSAVGVAIVEQLEGKGFFVPAPIFNMVPPKGMPAQLAFEPVVGAPAYIDTRLRSDEDYGVTGYLRNVTEAKRISAGRFTFWGTPWEAVHDPMRGYCAQSWEACGPEPKGGLPTRAFMRVPSQCSSPLLTTMSYETWARPLTKASAPFEEAAPVGCGAVPFDPAIEAKPTSSVADSPAGLHFDLHIPQAEHESPGGLGEADLRDVSVVLPVGLTANPAQADGLAACSPTQVGLSTPTGQADPVNFSLAPATCPNASKVGTVEAVAPALDHPITGSVYLAAQEENPFNSLLALYIVLEDEQSGVVVKLAAKVSPDPRTGQLTTTVTDNPQVPIEDFRFDFFEGARAPLRTPMTCATYTTATRMTPWSAPEAPEASPSDSFAISSGPHGPCPSANPDPKLTAGLANPAAGTYSPFSVRVSREDGTGEFAGLTIAPPLGFSARLAGVPYCSEAAIAQAQGRERPGGGAEEQAHPSCPQASQIGTISAGAGAGPSPFYVSGRLYLAGPYKGAPLSMVAVIPAVAGPFDLGAVVNRVAAYVDRETAQVKAVANPLPTIISGIPVDARDIRVDIDRPNFALAPTSCEPKSVTATVQGTNGQSATASQRFQVGGCEKLKFSPKISLRLKGGTKRSDHPALEAVVTYPQKGAYANTAKASVALPHSEFLEQAHIRTICTRVQFAAGACPKGAIYGKARAFTPLLEKPLEGPIYLRSSSNPLPDLVLDLHGQIDVAAVARIDSHKGGIRTSFESIPDAPLSKVIVQMPAGKKGLLVNSRNICNHPNRATAKFVGQNGKTAQSRPVLKDSCKKKHKGAKKHRGKGAKKGR